jgi:putative transposase
MGQRRRYRLLELERLCWRLGAGDLDQVRPNLEAALAEAVARGEVKREPIWTESLAIGSAEYVQEVKPLILSRGESEVVQTADGMNVLRESPVVYGPRVDLKNGPEAQH